jgi:2-phosphosulfolactate phosphatase
MKIQVALLPSLIELTDLTQTTVIVVDVLRATTVMATALQFKAARVVTCLEIEDALQLRNRIAGKCVLGGERGGLPIEGFDYGNSPCDYESSCVQDSTLIQTTTNGTLAIDRCRTAGKLLTAAFVNLSAVVGAIENDAEVLIVCAGTNRQITGEDTLLAGALIDQAAARIDVEIANDQAWLARQAWHGVRAKGNSASGLTDTLYHTCGGRNLRRLGLEKDVSDAAQIDRFNIVPICIDRNVLTFVGR